MPGKHVKEDKFQGVAIESQKDLTWTLENFSHTNGKGIMSVPQRFSQSNNKASRKFQGIAPQSSQQKPKIYPEDVCRCAFCLLDLTSRSFIGDTPSSQKRYI